MVVCVCKVSLLNHPFTGNIDYNGTYGFNYSWNGNFVCLIVSQTYRNLTYWFLDYSQSHLVETAVYDLVHQLQTGLSEEDQANLTAEEGYQCYSPDVKNKKSRCQECIACSYYTLLNYFTQRNTEALVKGMTWLLSKV